MTSQFHGLLKEVIENYPNISLTNYLAEKLHLPIDKAEILASRIKKQHLEACLEKDKHVMMFHKAEKLPNTPLYSLYKISHSEFAYFIVWLLEGLGFKLQNDKTGTDGGLNLTAEMGDEKLIINAIHCPITHCISDGIIFIAQEAKLRYAAKQALVITTAYFTEQAKAEAERLHVELWDADTLIQKISELKQKEDHEIHVLFPQYRGSLLKSLLALQENQTFLIIQKADGIYDLTLPGIKYPLLTFKTQNDKVSHCMLRIKYNEPVAENKGTIIVGFDENGKGMNINESEAYNEVTRYLEQFID